jgi:hypothetical protein
VHFSTSSSAGTPKRIAARAASQIDSASASLGSHPLSGLERRKYPEISVSHTAPSPCRLLVARLLARLDRTSTLPLLAASCAHGHRHVRTSQLCSGVLALNYLIRRSNKTCLPAPPARLSTLTNIPVRCTVVQERAGTRRNAVPTYNRTRTLGKQSCGS